MAPHPNHPPRAVLRLLDLDDDRPPRVLDGQVLHIGRARATCGLVLTGPGVAPHHCSLRLEGGRWFLRDRGAPAGTYVASRRVQEPTELRDGDRISIGLHLLEFRTTPALALPQVLARLRDVPIDLSFADCAPDPITPPATTARPRSESLLRSASLAAALALAFSFVVATQLAPAANPLPTATRSTDSLPDRSVEARPAISTDSLPDGFIDALPAGSTDLLSNGSTDAPATDLRTTDPRPVLSTVSPMRSEYLAEPPTFELPTDAVTRGRPDAGALVRALTLPPSPDYTVRCPAHAHGSAATISELLHALASFRNRSGYRGEIVVGDLSQRAGGRYGPHRSHQSGRDVDLWLPVRGGVYRRGCVRCGTDLCRPEPHEVDWLATWHLIKSLTARDAVQDIFLDWSLQPALIAAARLANAPAALIDRQIQHPIRGRATLIKHAAGHIHHMHVRFRCPAGAADCVATP